VPGRTDWVFVAVTDDAFASAAAVSLLSAAGHCSRRPTCLVVDFGMSRATRAVLAQLFAFNGVTLAIRAADPARYAGLPLTSHLQAATYGRLAVAELAADLAEFSLYLDADTLTVSSVDDLLGTDLHGQPVGAVRDPSVQFVCQPGGVSGWARLGLPPATGFFNAGVLLIDNQEWCDAGVSARALELLEGHPEEATFADQGALNAVLAGGWLPLEPRWNVPVPRSLAVTVGGRVVSRHRMTKLSDIGILHFLGVVKPWDRDYVPSAYRRMYEQAMSTLTPGLDLPRHLHPFQWMRARR
jgi:lipopolysaccharide biosynthesis glycosyltransferase